MHNLEKKITDWRNSAGTKVSADTLDELETHLRETTEQLVRSGINLPEAFDRALADLGNLPRIESEFRKLNEPLWLPVKLAVGATALSVLALAILVVARSHPGGSGELFAAHVFTVTLGYTLTLLIGGMGICFVSQRCIEDFSTSRLHSIARVSLVLSSIALFLTVLGILLGMLWAKIEWGRYWAWDSKEIGGLSTVVWLACYLVAHRFFKRSERGVLGISLLGNIVVSLAWFGPYVPTSLPLNIVILVNLACFAIGFAPADRLRLTREG